MLSGKFALGLPVLSDLAGIKLKKIRWKFFPLARLTLTSFRNFPLYVSGETARDKKKRHNRTRSLETEESHSSHG